MRTRQELILIAMRASGGTVTSYQLLKALKCEWRPNASLDTLVRHGLATVTKPKQRGEPHRWTLTKQGDLEAQAAENRPVLDIEDAIRRYVKDEETVLAIAGDLYTVETVRNAIKAAGVTLRQRESKVALVSDADACVTVTGAKNAMDAAQMILLTLYYARRPMPRSVLMWKVDGMANKHVRGQLLALRDIGFVFTVKVNGRYFCGLTEAGIKQAVRNRRTPLIPDVEVR